MTPDPNSDFLQKQDFKRLLHDAWGQYVLADDVEPDVELIAAFLDDALDEESEAALAEHLEESPRAFELMVRMLEPGRSLPRLRAAALPQRAGVVPAVTSASQQQAASEPSGVRVWLALAAGLLLAVGLGGSLWQAKRHQQSLLADNQRIRSQLADLQRLDRQRFVAEKRQLADAASGHGQLYLAGVGTSHLLANAFQGSAMPRARGGVAEDDRQVMNHALQTLDQSLEDLGQDADTFDSQLERAVARIWAGKYSEADQILTDLERNYASPELTNARGAWHATRRGDLLEDEARRAGEMAEAAFRTAADEGLTDAMLNLLFLREEQGDIAGATAAARKFLQSNQDPVAARWVEAWLETKGA